MVAFKKLENSEDTGYIKLGRGQLYLRRHYRSYRRVPVYSSSAVGVGEFGRYGKYIFDKAMITWSVDGGGKFFYRPKHKYSVTILSGWPEVLKPDKLSLRFYTMCLTHSGL